MEIITHKINCARSFIEYVLSYLIISSRSVFCLVIFFSSNQNVAELWLHRKIHSGHNFWKDGIAKFCKVKYTLPIDGKHRWLPRQFVYPFKTYMGSSISEIWLLPDSEVDFKTHEEETTNKHSGLALA